MMRKIFILLTIGLFLSGCGYQDEKESYTFDAEKIANSVEAGPIQIEKLVNERVEKEADKKPVITIDAKAPLKDYTIEDVKTAVEKEFPQWIAMWKELDPNFDISHFEYRESDIVVDIEWPMTQELTDLQQQFLSFSPDKTRYLDPYAFMYELSQDKETGEIKIKIIGGDPDVQVGLIENDTYKRILSCGTPCTYEKAIWLDDSVFIVLGSGEDSSGQYKTPDIYLFNLYTNKIKLFSGNGVPYEAFWGHYDLEKLLN